MFQGLPFLFTMFHNFWASKRGSKRMILKKIISDTFYHEIMPAARGFWGASIEIYKGLIIIKFLGTICAMHERTDKFFGRARRCSLHAFIHLKAEKLFHVKK